MPERGIRKERTGTVVSDKMDKTAVVKVDRLIKHPLYGKIIKRSSKIMVHDENNECAPGDIVRVKETRPLSRRKRWILAEIVKKAE